MTIKSKNLRMSFWENLQNLTVRISRGTILNTKLIKEISIKLKQDKSDSFLDIWFIDNVRREIDHVFKTIKQEKDVKIRKIIALILSRTIRSCRATTHSDLATLKEPQLTTYYCYKHKKICKPLFSIKTMLNRYAFDALNRIR